MNQSIRLLSIALTIIIAISCTKQFLEVEDTTQAFRQNTVTDLTSLQAYTRGLVMEVACSFEYGGGSGYADIIADNLRPTDPGKGLFTQYNWQQEADASDNSPLLGTIPDVKSTNPLWITGYRIIRNCNFVIEQSSQYDATTSNTLKGQALAIRAYLHFRLVNVFAQHYSFTADASHPGIPYITTSNVRENFPRLSVNDTYKKIIEDLESASSLIAAAEIDPRAFTRESVKALLVRTYLYKEDHLKSLQLALELTQNRPLMTISEGYPKKMFMLAPSSKSGEILLQLSPQGASQPGSTSFLGVFFSTTLTYYATSDMAQILTENKDDVRSSWVTEKSGSWLVKKFPENVTPEVTPAPRQATGAYYPPVFRAAELYLTIAECSAKSGDEVTAQQYLNAVRLRANPNSKSVTDSGKSLIDSIHKERRKELSFENQRMFDIQRWKQAVNRKDVLTGSPTTLSYPSSKAIAPIPPNDVKLTGISQNIDY